jgi:hypothetical protein
MTIIIFRGLTFIFPRLHGLDGSRKCYSSKQWSRAHPPVSTSNASCHLPHTPSTFFYPLPIHLSQKLPCFNKPTPSHMHLYAPHAQIVLISHDAPCQTRSLDLVRPSKSLHSPHIHMITVFSAVCRQRISSNLIDIPAVAMSYIFAYFIM